jgi:effector-binding domain-containing protein
MSIEVTVKQTDPRTVAFIPMKGPYDRIEGTFGRLFGWVGQKGYVPAGPPLGIYLNSPEQAPPDELLWELQCPLGGDVPPVEPDASGVGVKKVGGIEVASTVHQGPFDEVGQTYGMLWEWINTNGYEIVGPSEEVYFSDPSTTPSQELTTEIRFPVRKK